MINIVDKCREEALEICKSKIFGLKICLVFILVVILIMLIAGRFKPGFLISGFVVFILFAVVLFPSMSKELKLKKIVETETPVKCTATHLGWEREGKRSLRVAYFLYDGKEEYAIDYREGRPKEVHENDTIYVWKYKKTFLMVKAEEK